MKVDPKDLDNTLIVPKCQSYLKPLLKKKKDIQLKNIGSPSNNQLLDFVYCQFKVQKQKCKKVEKVYRNCHSSVMGTGSFEGRKHCEDELNALIKCVVPREH